jgi:hypothetical protein
MTREQRYLIRCFIWLCDELIAGNQIGPEKLKRWADQANRELQRDRRNDGEQQ